MRRAFLLILLVLCVAVSGHAQGYESELEKVMALLDRASAKFHSVQADFISDTFHKEVEQHEYESGTLCFRRVKGSFEVALEQDIKKDSHRKVVVKEGKVLIFHFKSKSLEEHSTGNNREDIESYLALGFGGSGSDLKKNFDVRYAGIESVNGRATYKLELLPKSEKVRDMFSLITLWIDQSTGMSLRQKLQEGKYNYRLATYSNVIVDGKLPKSAFDVKAQQVPAI